MSVKHQDLHVVAGFVGLVRTDQNTVWPVEWCAWVAVLHLVALLGGYLQHCLNGELPRRRLMVSGANVVDTPMLHLLQHLHLLVHLVHVLGMLLVVLNSRCDIWRMLRRRPRPDLYAGRSHDDEVHSIGRQAGGCRDLYRDVHLLQACRGVWICARWRFRWRRRPSSARKVEVDANRGGGRRRNQCDDGQEEGETPVHVRTRKHGLHGSLNKSLYASEHGAHPISTLCKRHAKGPS